ncbi:MAG: polyprenyl synthetase family protein [Mycobacteriales bacterium]
MSAAPSTVEFDDPILESAVRAGLDAVEKLLRESVQSNFDFVTAASRHLVDAGGKRFRPLLVLLSAQFGDPHAPAVVPAAVAIELTHLSTLYHDDVMDEAPLRRGAASANSRWDNTVAILTGDFLFARASEITADLGTEATRILARTISVLCEGQIRETVGPPPGADRVAHYLQVVAEKTAPLIATSARLGGLLAGADPRQVEILRRYGAVIGTAFQISDDLIDMTSGDAESGKAPGTDLREGVQTLPVLYALRAGDATAVQLQHLLAGPRSDDGWVPEALSLLRAHPALDETRATLAEYAGSAQAVASELPESSARLALETLAEFVVARTN